MRQGLGRRVLGVTLAGMLALVNAVTAADGYSFDTVVPTAGGCPQIERASFSLTAPLTRRWNTALPTAQTTVLTVAAPGTSAQLTEIENAIADSFGAWTGVTGTTLNAASFPGVLGPLTQVNSATGCTNDGETNVDGINTICFNQASAAFTTGVLAFTRVIVANAPGVSVGSSGPAAFAGQILDADTLFRPDGQVTFATPAALATTAGQGAYDLESLLKHELGHQLGLDHYAVIRAMMFPFAPSPGTFLGTRPTPQAPDAPLSDDDRTGIRFLYPDPSDTLNIGAIRGQIVPANPFALAGMPATSTGQFVTGMFGGHVVAIDAATGSVVAGALSGWSCNASNGVPQFDGSYDIERLPVGRNYVLYAEPLTGLATADDFADALGGMCASTSGGAANCTAPAANTNFNVTTVSAVP
jgi:hypothetical protein